jgi:hypothetical protein
MALRVGTKSAAWHVSVVRSSSLLNEVNFDGIFGDVDVWSFSVLCKSTYSGLVKKEKLTKTNLSGHGESFLFGEKSPPNLLIIIHGSTKNPKE